MDTSLYNWNQLQDWYEWTGILLGNGSSMAVWDRFGYDSLFRIATLNGTVDNPLQAPDIAIFDGLGTKTSKRSFGH